MSGSRTETTFFFLSITISFACLVNHLHLPKEIAKLKEHRPMTLSLHVSMTTTITEEGKKLTYNKHYAF